MSAMAFRLASSLLPFSRSFQGDIQTLHNSPFVEGLWIPSPIWEGGGKSSIAAVPTTQLEKCLLMNEALRKQNNNLEMLVTQMTMQLMDVKCQAFGEHQRGKESITDSPFTDEGSERGWRVAHSRMGKSWASKAFVSPVPAQGPSSSTRFPGLRGSRWKRLYRAAHSLGHHPHVRVGELRQFFQMYRTDGEWTLKWQIWDRCIFRRE